MPYRRLGVSALLVSLCSTGCSSGATTVSSTGGGATSTSLITGAGGGGAGGTGGTGTSSSTTGSTGGAGGSAGDAGTDASADADAGAPPLVDPGSAPWVPVPEGEVLARCRLDPAKLAEADEKLDVPWAIVRYGLLCHEHKSADMIPAEAWSTTKTLGATVAGIVAYRSKGLVDTGPHTGPFSDEDRVDHWLDSFSYNKEARVAHVLAMVAKSDDLSLGHKEMKYDTVGTDQINSLSGLLRKVMEQDPVTMGTDLEDFTQKHLYVPLGMTDSTWNFGLPGKVFAYSWGTTVRDMARLGLLLLHRGMWNGERLLDAEWIYRMTHPSFEDANTAYGYLTWVNASSNFSYGGIPGAPGGVQQGAALPGPCAPRSVYPTHPHGLSDSPDCNYAAPASCAEPIDDGVWQAVGVGGQVIQGHPGLEMLIIARDAAPFTSGMGAPTAVWDAVRPAVIAADPMFAGDEGAFCTVYGGNAYAPDLL